MLSGELCVHRMKIRGCRLYDGSRKDRRNHPPLLVTRRLCMADYREGALVISALYGKQLTNHDPCRKTDEGPIYKTQESGWTQMKYIYIYFHSQAISTVI